MNEQRFPKNWDEQRARQLIAELDARTDEAAASTTAQMDILMPDPNENEAAVVSETIHNADGVDRTLIRWFLSLTPAERLEAMERFANDILELRNAGPGTISHPGNPE